MDDSASNARFRLIVLLILAAVIALASFWLAEVMRRNSLQMNAAEKPNEPDYFVENFQVLRVAASGQPHYILSGEKLTHRPVTDLSDINNAQMLAFNPGQTPLHTRGDQAQIEHQSNRIKLLGNVKVVRAAGESTQGWTMKTQALLLVPDDDQITTDLPVEIVSGKSIITGTGMFIDNTNGIFRLSQQVHSVILPANKASTGSKP